MFKLSGDTAAPRVAIVYPMHQSRLSEPGRSIVLTAHATLLARELRAAGMDVQTLSVGEELSEDASDRLLGKAWTNQTARKLFARLGKFAPHAIVIEHSPLAFLNEPFVPISVASWARLCGCALIVATHPDFGRTATEDEAVLESSWRGLSFLRTASEIVSHDERWSGIVSRAMSPLRNEVVTLESWALCEYNEDRHKLVDEPAQSLIILDDASRDAMRNLAEAICKFPQAGPYAVLHALSASFTQRPVPIAPALGRLGLPIVQPATLDELEAEFARSPAVLVAPAGGAVPWRWRETTAAFGSTYIWLGPPDAVTLERSNESAMTFEAAASELQLLRPSVAQRLERIAEYQTSSAMQMLARRIAARIFLAQNLEAGLEKRSQQSPVARRETA